MRETYDYRKANNVKSKYQMNVHDELSFEKHKDEIKPLFDIQKIMEDWPDTQVPIVADMEVTTTNWATKESIANEEALRVYLST